MQTETIFDSEFDEQRDGGARGQSPVSAKQFQRVAPRDRGWQPRVASGDRSNSAKSIGQSGRGPAPAASSLCSLPSDRTGRIARNGSLMKQQNEALKRTV